MKSISTPPVWHFRSADAGFIAVVSVAYFSALLRARYGGLPPYSRGELFILIASSLIYLIVGTYGFAFCRRKASSHSAALYLVVQGILATTILYLLPGGAIFLIILPLAGQSVILLPRIWAAVFCVTLLMILVVPIGWHAGFFTAFVAGSFVLAALVFVIVCTLLAVNEADARQEVELLAAELKDANQKLREYASQVEELATLRERSRIAREIHDSLGHYLTIVNVQIEAARAVLASEPQRAGEILHKAQTLTREGLTEVRRSVSELRNSPGDLRPLPEILELLADECRITGVDTNLVVMGEPSPLSLQAKLTLYRAAQEGLTNVRRHASASCATLKLDFSDNWKVRLQVEDDGVGSADSKEGFGLMGIRERVKLLDGKVFLRSAPGAGFSLEVELPR
jgi:signal transduction histidine kinase